MASELGADQLQPSVEAVDPRDLAEAQSAGGFVQALLKATKGFKLYLPNNPLYEKFFEQLAEALEAHVDRFGLLQLDLDQVSVQCRGILLYESKELGESLVFRMYSDGIRSIQFHPGMDVQELRTFVEIAAMPTREGDEEDLVTRLWHADLAHFRYVLVEESVGTAHGDLGMPRSPLGVGGGSSIMSSVSRIQADSQAGIILPEGLKEVPQSLFTLQESEVASIQALVQDLETRSPQEDVAEILRAILSSEQDMEVFQEFLEIITKLCADLLVTQRLEGCLPLMRVLGDLAFDDRLGEAQRDLLKACRGRIVTEDALAKLREAVASRGSVSSRFLEEFIRLLGPEGVVPGCVLLGEAESRETRRVLMEVLVPLGVSAPQCFFPILKDPRWYLLRNTIIILRRIGDRRADEPVRAMSLHRDSRVRREVMHYFDELSGSLAESVMLQFLEDVHLPLRMSAIRSLARKRSEAGRLRLLDMVRAPGFDKRDLAERKTLFEALADLDPVSLVSMSAEILHRPYWFWRERGARDVACVVAGLRRMGGPQAQSLIQEALTRHRGRIQRVLLQALEAQEEPRG